MSLSPRVSHSRLLICGIGHIPKTARTWMDAFANDPVVRYTRQTPVRDLAFFNQDYRGGNGAIEKAIERVVYQLLIALCIRTKITRTVNKGGSFVLA
jgi:hypothetical protein